MILHAGRVLTLPEALAVVRARYGASAGGPVLSSERPLTV